MGRCFFEVTLRGKAGIEAIDNVFWYSALIPAVSDPTNTDVISAAREIGMQLAPVWAGQLPTDYQVVDAYCRPYKDDGTPGTAIPQSWPLGNVGSVATPRDGNTLVAIFKPALDTIQPLVTGHSPLKRSYFAYGPLCNSQVDNDGAIASAAFVGLNGVASIAAQTLTLLTIPFYFPIKVSKTASGALTPNITAYRGIVTCLTNPRSSVRVSRKNGR